MFQRKGLLTPERVTLMQSWAHSGFNVNAQVRIGADDVTGRENLARYLIRVPFSINKIRYDPAARSVIYKTKMVAGSNRNFAGSVAARLAPGGSSGRNAADRSLTSVRGNVTIPATEGSAR